LRIRHTRSSPTQSAQGEWKKQKKFAEVVPRKRGQIQECRVYADSQSADIQHLIAGMQLGMVDMA
jgi:hypothetical protein